MLVNTQLNKIKNIIIKDTSEKDVKELIDYYVELSKSNIPIWFNKALENTEATDQDVAEMDEILAGLV